LTALSKSWLLTAEQLAGSQQRDLEFLTTVDVAVIHYHFARLLQEIGKTFSIHWRVIATAIAFFRRFYYKCAFVLADPQLIAPTYVCNSCSISPAFLFTYSCLHIAGKIEEAGIPHSKLANVLKRYRLPGKRKSGASIHTSCTLTTLQNCRTRWLMCSAVSSTCSICCSLTSSSFIHTDP